MLGYICKIATHATQGTPRLLFGAVFPLRNTKAYEQETSEGIFPATAAQHLCCWATTARYIGKEIMHMLQQMFYCLKDHLGNTRVVLSAPMSDCGSTVTELAYAADYYPYGKLIREFSNGEKERYLSTDHERDQETGYDHRGARYYDSEVGRFMSIDPLAADYPAISPYAYVADNPIANIDPDGRYIFGLFGSSKDQRKAADRYAQENGGTVINRHKRNIFVSYTEQTSGTLGGELIIWNRQQRFGKEGELLSQVPTISSPNKTRLDDWKESDNIVYSSMYGIVDQTYISLQASPFGSAVRKPSERRHLNGQGVTQSEVEKNVIESLSSLAPAGRGFGFLKKLNASGFSSLFKGNLAKLSPALRGKANRAINKVIERANGGKAIVLPIIKKADNIVNEQE